MDDLYEPMDRGSLEVIRRLEAFADARLEPTVAATTRMRVAVMAAAHRQAALVAADTGAATITGLAPSRPFAGLPAREPSGRPLPARPTPTDADAPHRRSWLDATVWRRPAVAIMAGCLTLGLLAGTALAVRPGGLLYEARIWTEAANLPAADDELARAEAEIHRLGARLDEVEVAAAAGDGAALTAALDAYAAIVTEAAAGTAGDPAAEQALQLTIERHVVILTQLMATGPAPARVALEHAIASSTAALDDIDGEPGVTNGVGPATNAGDGAGGHGGNGGPGGNNGNGAAGAGGSDSEKPAAAPTPTPTATPKPPKPAPTAGSTPPPRDRTPRSTATHQPPGPQGGDPSVPPSQDRQ